MTIVTNVFDARVLLRKGYTLAYPTEAVYGLGCDIYQQDAVERVLTLKKRDKSKGLIVLISTWEQLISLIAPISDQLLDPVRKSWPGPVTWVFPKARTVPEWISGHHEGIAIRMSAHDIAYQLCEEGPIVSTSANISGYEPARTLTELRLQFPEGLDAIMHADLGGLNQPSAIYDVQSGTRLR